MGEYLEVKGTRPLSRPEGFHVARLQQTEDWVRQHVQYYCMIVCINEIWIMMQSDNPVRDGVGWDCQCDATTRPWNRPKYRIEPWSAMSIWSSERVLVQSRITDIIHELVLNHVNCHPFQPKEIEKGGVSTFKKISAAVLYCGRSKMVCSKWPLSMIHITLSHTLSLSRP